MSGYTCPHCLLSLETWGEWQIHIEHNHVILDKHEHRYTVAVEWEYFRRDSDGDEPVFHSDAVRKKVTTLRCETCPEEIEREDN